MIIVFVGLIAVGIYYGATRLAVHDPAPHGTTAQPAEPTGPDDDSVEQPTWTARDDRQLTRLLKNSAP